MQKNTSRSPAWLHMFIVGLLCSSGSAQAAVTQDQFLATIAELQTQLAPWVQQTHGKELLVTGDWAKDYTPTSAGGSFYFPDGKWGVHVVGWVARSPEVSTDALRLIYCHELGHHIYGGGGEVESDYFASSTCAPLVFVGDHNGSSPTPEDHEACATAENSTFCERVMTAAHQANAFRASVWRRRNMLDEAGIEAAVACRRQVFLEGFLNQPMTHCSI